MSSIGTKFVLNQQFLFDPNSNSLIDQSSGNEITRLGSNESRILLLFAEHPNEIITRETLHEFVWRDQGFQVDDSSLTQAISTLRKMLKDTIRAPNYIKTVPKRGYQFIASVEKTVPLSSSITEKKSEPNLTKLSPSGDVSMKEKSQRNGQIIRSELADVKAQPTKNTPLKIKVVSRLLLIVATLLPLFVYLYSEPVPTQFKHIDTIQGVQLRTTENQPPLDDWTEVINQCVSNYLSTRDNLPIDIIITAGPTHNLIVNFIYDETTSSENMTVQLISRNYELPELCNQ